MNFLILYKLSVPIGKQLEVSPSMSVSRSERHAKQQQVQPQKQYISGSSYQKDYSSLDDFHQFNDITLPQQQQRQQYEEDDSWQPYNDNDEPIIYIVES